MTASKKRIADWEAAQIARAIGYTAVGFHGHPTGYERREATTLEGARVHKTAMLAENKITNFGRGVVIYAYTKDGVSIVVE